MFLDDLFAAGHIRHGTYYLAGYPDKGARSIMKIGFVDDLGVYANDLESRATEGTICATRGGETHENAGSGDRRTGRDLDVT